MAEAEAEQVPEPDFRWKALGNNGQYTLEDVQVRVAEYEEEYGHSSDSLLDMHVNGNAPPEISNFDRHKWLSLYREILESRR